MHVHGKANGRMPMQSAPHEVIHEQLITLQLAERFFESSLVFALHELGVIEALVQGPATLDELHGRVGGKKISLQAALDATVSLNIFTKVNGRYIAPDYLLTCLGDKNSSSYIGAWIEFLHAVAGPCMDMARAIQSGKSIKLLYEDADGESVASCRLTKAMDAFARSRGIEIVDFFDFSKTQRLLDLGCGPGTYSLAIVQKHPHIQATLLDLPGPIEVTRRIVDERGMSDTVNLVAGDAFEWNPPEPFDTVFTSNILHMLGAELAQKLIRRAFEFTAPGGRLIIQAQYLNDDLTSPRWATLLNLMMLVGTDNGRNHALGETSEWMCNAGFTNIQWLRLSPWNVNRCLIGQKP
jgi:precorrin-6B methylase 2